MKIKLLASSVLMASALMMSGAASAAVQWSWQGTLTDWQTEGSIVDQGTQAPGVFVPPGTNCLAAPVGGTCGNGNTTFTFISSSIIDPNTTNVSLKEEEYSGNPIGLYNLDIGWADTQSSGEISYSLTTTDPTGFDLAALDTTVSLIGNVSKLLYATLADLTADTNRLLTLNSVDGARDPITGLSSFSMLQTVYIKDVINSGNINAIHSGITNSATVPEPLTISLMGIGLAAFGARRRFV